ncbi:MAG: hypothetical protein NT046_00715 [Arenimonas sp.]|nr:hypothetical protein [Arenimonas sp.]
MLLRRLTLHVREQNWTAIGIDFVIVVVGVFIGIQVANWNDDRATARKARDFTERLRADLLDEAWGYEMQVGYYTDVLDNAKRAADALEGDAPLSDEALLVAAYRATQYNGNTRRRATYDELVSTGELGLVLDPAMRQLAHEVYNSAQFDIIVNEGVNSAYRKAFRMTLPHGVQREVASACGDKLVQPGDFASVDDSLDYPCTTGLSPAQLADAVARLRTNPDLLPLLRLRLLDVETSLSNFTSLNPGSREALAELVRAKTGSG